MIKENNSRKQIFKSSAIIGGASFVTILISLVKVKVLAVLLGPAGIGMMGILVTIMNLGSTFFGMGLETSGVRELALNNNDIKKNNLVRKVLFSANFILGILAIIIIIVFNQTLSEWFFETPDYQLSITVLAIGIFLTLISGSQTALLQGLRKITALAKVKVIGALMATVFGLFVVTLFGESGLPFLVIAMPLATCCVAFYYSRQLPRLNSSSVTIQNLRSKWKIMFSLGLSFMLTGLLGAGCQLIVRYIINKELNIESVGYFQAAWQISMTYISFILAAMAADYYPRLTQKIEDKTESNRIVNEQTEISIIFSAPILLAMLAFSPLVINVLYSSQFIDATEILRWQVLGDVVKVISWPLGFIILAKGQSKLFFCTELIWNLSYISLIYSGISLFGIEITGYAFAISYFIYFLTVYLISRRINDFIWTKTNIKLILVLVIMSVILLSLSYLSVVLTAVLGFVFTIITMIYIIKKISELEISNRKVDCILKICNKIINKFQI